MRKSYKITLGILTILILITITIGTSYSYYSIGASQDDPNIVNTTCFNVTYDDASSNSINLTATKPMTVDEGLNTNPYSFTIQNTCTAANGIASKYVITLNTLTDPASTLPTKYLKYSLGEGSAKGTATAFPTTTYALNETLKTKYKVKDSYQILEEGTLAPGTAKTFNLRIWLDDVNVNCVISEDGTTQTCTPNDVMGRNFRGKILVYNYL